jgi:hypothetical protein
MKGGLASPTFLYGSNNWERSYLSKSQYPAAQEQFEKVINLNPMTRAPTSI